MDDNYNNTSGKKFDFLLIAQETIVVLFLDVQHELLAALLQQLGHAREALDRHHASQLYRIA